MLARLVTAAGGPAVNPELHSLWSLLTAEVRALSTVTYRTLPETGLLLDSTPWQGLPFVEGETLHYKPAKAEALKS